MSDRLITFEQFYLLAEAIKRYAQELASKYLTYETVELTDANGDAMATVDGEDILAIQFGANKGAV